MPHCQCANENRKSNMEKIFTYLAAVFTRLLFAIHATLMMYWLTLVKQNDSPYLYYLFFGLLLCTLIAETAMTVGYRKGHEYNWFCPSMFLYLMAVIPCDWLAKNEVIKCLNEATNAKTLCNRAVNGSGDTLQGILANLQITDDERLLYTMEQALVLILVIGRWLLPKGEITRDQLSQLLLIYVGMAADIMEFTEVIKEEDIRRKNPEMMQNKAFVNAMLLFWSISLLQFTLTVSAMERTAQRLEKEKAQLEEELKKAKEEKALGAKRNQIVPSSALYTYQKTKQRNELHLKFIQTSRGLEIKPERGNSVKKESQSPDKVDQAPTCRFRCINKVKKAFATAKNTMQNYVELASLMIPMFMQDGPFLVMRLIIITKFDIYDDTLYFLTCKNALVVMLQVYRIFVLYYVPPEKDTDELFPEDLSSKLRNVQTAVQSAKNTRMVIKLVSRLQKSARQRRESELGEYNDPETGISNEFYRRKIENGKRRLSHNAYKGV